MSKVRSIDGNVTPIEVADAVPWERAKGVIVLVDLGDDVNIHMSGMDLDKAAYMSKCLDAVLTEQLVRMYQEP